MRRFHDITTARDGCSLRRRVSDAGPLRRLGVRPGPAFESLPRRKPRGGGGRLASATYGDLRIADGWRARRRRPAALGVFGGSDDGGRFRWRRCAAGEALARRSEEDWRPCEDVALVLRRAAGGEGDRRLRGGMRGDGHEVSILIRLGDGDRAGRGPSNVSTMIIRPPQHGQRRAGETSSASTVGLGAKAGAHSLPRRAAWRARSMLSRANRAGEQAVVADAVEAARQHVQEKAADELGGVERHGLEPVAAFDPVVLPFEGDARLVERDEPGVRDRDAVGVAGEIGENGLAARRTASWRRRPIRSGATARARRRRRACRRAARGRRRRRGGRPACRAASPSRKSRRNRRESTRTGRKKPGLQAIQRDPSGDRPPPGTMTWTCGWWVSAEPQVCSTAVRPMRAPRCFGSAAIVVSVSAAVLNRRS